jgi:hypothetical protein
MFNEIVTLWSHIDMKRKMKLFMSPIDEVYTVAAFFTNLHGLVYTNKVAHFYGVTEEYGKMSVHEYLGLVYH